MLILGLTGGIASGKSTVSNYFKEQGYPVVDADLLARQVVEPGTPAFNRIVDYFGPLTGDLVVNGQLDRTVLGKAIFDNEKNRKVLNGIIHPAVRHEMLKQVLWAWVRGYSLVVLDVPLLFEGNLDKMCGTTLLVSCADATQMQRLRARDPHLSEQDARDRITSQMPTSEKAKRADFVLENDGSVDELYAGLDAYIASIKPSAAVTAFQWVPLFGALCAAYRYYNRSKL